MRGIKKEKGILAAAIGIRSSAILAPTASGREVISPHTGREASPSNLQTCSSHFNCYALGSTTGFIADGAAARFELRPYTAPDWNKTGFAAHTLWVGVNSSPNSSRTDWIEIGWTKGFEGSSAGYAHYWAWGDLDNPDPNLRYDQGLIYWPVGEMGTSHLYDLHRYYDGLYKGYIDAQEVIILYFPPFTLFADVGLEYTHPNATAAQNDPRDLQWRRSTDLQWFNWGSLGTPVNQYEFSNDGDAWWEWETFPTSGEDGATS